MPKEAGMLGDVSMVRDDDIMRISGCPTDIDLRYFEKIFLGQLIIRYPVLQEKLVSVTVQSQMSFVD